jgi:hypothetical protein
MLAFTPVLVLVLGFFRIVLVLVLVLVLGLFRLFRLTQRDLEMSSRTPNGLPSVAKSPICVASLRRSSVTYSRYAPSSLLALLASRRFRSVRQPDRRSSLFPRGGYRRR